MRLLHTTQLTFKEFFDDNIPPYCILSHRWGGDEVSYNDFLAGRNTNSKGYAKILAACEYTFRVNGMQNPYDWIWIDTCCIDKSSSAELTEAINSMYAWYSGARICFAYLHDATFSNDIDDAQATFRKSDWHTRGWTLQELLAPRRVRFLDQNWRSFGTKQSLADTISEVTKISSQHLFGLFEPSCASVAEKMSWAAQRQTSRCEDQAYCLLGLLDINMPLLYGEGSKAFRRLQLELVKTSDDESIFIWELDSNHYSGVLASSPALFRMPPSCGTNSFVRVDVITPRYAYNITNKGLEIHFPTILARHAWFLLPLNCSHYSDKVYAIALERTGNHWRRAKQLPLVVPEHVSTAGPGLFVVDRRELWDRETLRASGSEIIQVRLG